MFKFVYPEQRPQTYEANTVVAHAIRIEYQPCKKS